MQSSQSALLQLECLECGKGFNPDKLQTFCPDCSGPLLAVYDLASARVTLTRVSLAQRPTGLWRWNEILPVRAPAFHLTLGEADTPLLKASNLGERLGLSELYIKDESHGPMGSWHAREMALSVARALELGVRHLTLAAAGSDGAALAAYAARARVWAHIYSPKNASLPDQVAITTLGAELNLVDGPFSAALDLAGEAARLHKWLDLSAFKEPYRCEGIKSIGLELAEAFNWDLPDLIIVSASVGLGILGIWKAFFELEGLGLIGAGRPRMIIVQAQGWQAAYTGPVGLYVPHLLADRQILRILQASNGSALAVSDEEILVCQKEMAISEGIFMGPEGAACLAAARQLITAGTIGRQERVVLINPDSGLNYL